MTARVAKVPLLERQSAQYKEFAVRAKKMLIQCKEELDVKAERIARLESALALRSIERAKVALRPQEEASKLTAATARILAEQAESTRLQNQMLLAPLRRENEELESQCALLKQRDMNATDVLPMATAQRIESMAGELTSLRSVYEAHVMKLRGELRDSVESANAHIKGLISNPKCKYRHARGRIGRSLMHSSASRERAASMR